MALYALAVCAANWHASTIKRQQQRLTNISYLISK
jgi:hypothetical protein